MIDIRYDKYNVLTEIALFFLLGNALLFLDETPLLRILFSGIRMLVVGYAILLIIHNRKADAFTWLAILFYAVLGVITFRHHGSTIMWASYLMNTLGISVLTYYSIKRSEHITIHIYAKIFAIFIYLNFLTMLIAPGGILNGSYPLGSNYNQVGAKLICGMAIYIVAYRMQIRRYLHTLILLVTCTLTPLMLGSMTSAVGCMLMLVFFFISNDKIRKIVIISFFIFYLAFQAFVVFMQSDLSENKEATYFIEDVLGKDLTFTSRARVWLEVTDYIAGSPSTGYGLQNSEWFEDQFRVKSAHNIILQIMVYGGYILLTAFLLVIILSIKRSLKNKTSINQTMLFGLEVLFFMMMMENYPIVLILIMLNILYYTPDFSESVTGKNTISNE